MQNKEKMEEEIIQFKSPEEPLLFDFFADCNETHINPSETSKNFSILLQNELLFMKNYSKMDSLRKQNEVINDINNAIKNKRFLQFLNILIQQNITIFHIDQTNNKEQIPKHDNNPDSYNNIVNSIICLLV